MWRAAPCLSLLAACAFGGPTGGGDPGGGDTGGGGIGGGSGGGGATAPDASCPSVSFTANHTMPSVQFLIDRSTSMGYTLDASTTGSRYQAVTDATMQVVSQLQDRVYFGASLFTQSNTQCPQLNTTAARQLRNLSQVQTLIQSYGPSGFTPTAAAVQATAALFVSNPPPAKSPPVIVLATDGLPNNCQAVGDPQADTLSAISAAHATGIRTFVLGISGVDEAYLQDMANAGAGVAAGQKPAPYFTASTAADLDAALAAIVGGVASCELAITGTVDLSLADKGTVTLDGTLLKYGTDWDLLDASTLRLRASACDQLKTQPQAHVEATFPCDAIIY